jgi:tetratricopeptide (TPR) repeat protein
LSLGDPLATARSVADEIEDLAAAAMDAADLGQIAETERLGRKLLRRAKELPAGVDRERGLARGFRASGTALRARGRYHDAERAFDRAIPSAVAAFGAVTLEVAELYNDLGMTFKYIGRFAEAEGAYEQARTILEALPDADPEDLAALS